MKFYPEGNNKSLCRKFEDVDELKKAMLNNEIIEGKVLLCDREHNLHVDLGGIRGIIPRTEGAVGIEEGTTRDIALISKVNKTVCFNVIGFEKDIYDNYIAILSRRAVQQKCIDEYLSLLSEGDIIDAKVTHLERFGAFIDIGAGINALIPIDMLSVSRISHPNERLIEGESIKVVLRKREPEKLTFSLKELLGTWKQNSDQFSAGETTTGVVRSIEDYGVFVELTPNLAGLAEPHDNLIIGQQVAVFVKSVIEEKMKIKLVIVETFSDIAKPDPLSYFISDGHIDFWQYSPAISSKQIYTDFEQ
ncbi:MAG: S1 RNA-binding domain-containing protein [Acetobacter sp.]|nr:S1 RNA-binding domain-containing protein [Bacteroides sp.]MCM1341199.1 S1 RNA-binding domain-containing protein [Acetobacter sp.]MCM1433842.1 S1 RNA-binding domain-containing protein [Clostridiales bacterium]